ncbi:MAG: hypothetical protein DRI34_10785 [Deltaproteobacteria bacterium]|nr:MAG: hypothetical protein DRI34_10785 [Deltaproteobacteria bacterium]
MLRVTVICMVVISFVARAAAEGPIVAVFDMEDQGSGLEHTVLVRLTDYLATRLTEGGYRVIPRSQVKERLLEAKKESYKKCYDQGCQIELGRELAAQKSLATTILKIGGECQLTSVLYDLKKSTTELAASAEAPCEEKALLEALKKVAAKLAKPLSEGEISAEAARETLQVMTRLEQLKKEKRKLEAEARAAEEKRREEEKKQQELAARAEQARREAERAQQEAERARQEAERARREAEATRSETAASRAFWARFKDSLRFEMEIRGDFWGNEFVGEEGGYFDSSAEIDHNETLLYRGSQDNPDVPDAYINGRKLTGQIGVGGRLGLRMMKYHTVFLIVDYLWQDWAGDTRDGQLLDWSLSFGVIRVGGGYRFSYPLLGWLEPYIEAAMGADIYLPTTAARRHGDEVTLEPLDESPLAVMLGAGVRFSFLDHLYASIGYLWDLPIGKLTCSSWLLAAGAYF